MTNLGTVKEIIVHTIGDKTETVMMNDVQLKREPDCEACVSLIEYITKQFTSKTGIHYNSETCNTRKINNNSCVESKKKTYSPPLIGR